ncbi:DNA polymerase III subunit beta [Aliivibrio salmonicida]
MKVHFESARKLSFWLSHPCSLSKRAIANSKHSYSEFVAIGVSMGDGVALIGVNDSRSYYRTIDTTNCNIEKSGSIAAHAKKLQAIIKTLGDRPVTLELVDKTLFVVSNKTKMRCETIDVKHYPRPDQDPTLTTSIDVNLELFKMGLNKVLSSMPEKEIGASSGKILEGVNISIANNYLVFTATDSHKINIFKMPLSCNNINPKLEINITIPKAAVIGQLSSITSESETATLGFNSNTLSLLTGSLKYQTALINGKFPDASTVLPNSFIAQYIFDRSELNQAIERVSLALEQDESPRMQFEIKKGIKAVTIFAGQDNNKKSEDSVSTFGGVMSDTIEEISTQFNFHYLRSILGSMGAEQVKFSFAYSIRAGQMVTDQIGCIISPNSVSEQGCQHFCLITPLR